MSIFNISTHRINFDMFLPYCMPFTFHNSFFLIFFLLHVLLYWRHIKMLLQSVILAHSYRSYFSENWLICTINDLILTLNNVKSWTYSMRSRWASAHQNLSIWVSTAIALGQNNPSEITLVNPEPSIPNRAMKGLILQSVHNRYLKLESQGENHRKCFLP